jgi:hypothetical protein
MEVQKLGSEATEYKTGSVSITLALCVLRCNCRLLITLSRFP